ncbi:MAG TPA: tetratricopeptide repeat protein [Pyrinomonadaceae bacterium]|nr:tetratricopeptide repeat protein [Pyrinomonadaceae bacterium]
MKQKTFGNGKWVLTIAACVVFTPVFCFAQDLGSTTGLFKSPSASKSKKSTTAKTKPKAATTSTKKSVTKSAKSSKTPTKTAPKQARNKLAMETVVKQPTVVEPEPQKNVIITVGAKTEELVESAITDGNAGRDERDYPRADAAYRRALSLNPNDSRGLYGLGNIYADQQRWEESEGSYRGAIRVDPANSGPYIALSYVLSQPIIGGDLSNRYAEAEQMARKAIEIDAENPFAYDQLGVALELRGIISEETQQAYLKAIAIEPEFALAYAHLGRLYRRLGKINESSESYRRAIQFSTDVPTMILVADVMQSQQRYLESEQLLRRALAEDPKNPTALNLLGRALTTRNSFDEAERVLTKSVQVSPNGVVAYTLLSTLHQRRGRLDEAERVLGTAFKIVSNNERKRLAREFESLGDAFSKINKPADAARLYRQAMALDSGRTILTEKIAAGSKQ